MFVFQETDEEESSDLIDGEALALSDPLKPRCPDVKRSLQEGEACLEHIKPDFCLFSGALHEHQRRSWK